MALQMPFPSATSSCLPDGVVVQPRRFEFRDLKSVPQYWFADNPIITHMENAFSILIPPGECFFIRSVRHFEDRVADPELKDLVRAFIQQEGLHTRAHNEFNQSLRRFGVDVEREIAYADRVMASMQKRLPRKMQLGVTVFLEHLTATGAHMLFMEPLIAESMHPEMVRFWRWHAAEELEHKGVAFDVFRAVGGGYFLRIFSAIAALLLLAAPFSRIVRRMMKEDRQEITAAMRQSAREMNRKLAGPQLRMIAQYFKPGFHPWNCDDEGYLREWYASPEGAWLSLADEPPSRPTRNPSMASNLPDTIPADFMAALAHLGTKDKLGVDEMKLMVLLETSGDPLYQKLASLAPEGEATELLLTNGREETAHAHRLKRAIEIATGESFELPSLDENPYAEPPPFTELTPELLAGFVAGEKNGDAGYQKWADNEPNPEIAELLRQNGRDETRHGERVARVAEILAG